MSPPLVPRDSDPAGVWEDVPLPLIQPPATGSRLSLSPRNSLSATCNVSQRFLRSARLISNPDSTGAPGPGFECMEQGDGVGGWGGESVSEARCVPTLKWLWHSKIMKNDDEAEEGTTRGPVCTAQITRQPPIGPSADCIPVPISLPVIFGGGAVQPGPRSEVTAARKLSLQPRPLAICESALLAVLLPFSVTSATAVWRLSRELDFSMPNDEKFYGVDN
ncbi:hypothetical protein EYF80_014564 [Liparis tanakae]|uniref:Uncharacterized protein n=1 Tax=Liparis tanakae TaxID=230148 RepID=A0A4Z2ICQ9_9TELE|nr:hypothetical protein EYF80_014564 [Liparis tanakae]